MTLDDLTLGQLREIQAMSLPGAGPAPPAQPSGVGHGRPVIVRSRDAGVQFGYLDRYEGSTVYLKNARQMWSWTAAKGGTLLDCATHGVKTGKFSAPADVVIIGACAIIDCAPEAVTTLEAQTWG